MEITTEEQVKNAIRWIDELGTTDAPQGTGELGDSEDGYCCLGFGCAILNLDYEPAMDFSIEFRDKVGLRTSEGKFKGQHVEYKKSTYTSKISSLGELNDNAEWSFKQISDFIKSRPEDLFDVKVGIALAEHYKVQQS